MIKRSMIWLVVVAAVMLLGGSSCVWALADETAADRDVRMGWWREAKFGMFIHWGPNAVLGGESPGAGKTFVPHETILSIRACQWNDVIKNFNPTKFDADKWVKIAKDAGIKYIVITAKHHDGFCIWPAGLEGYDITATKFKRDPLKELADACKRQGMKLGFYFSQLDWHDPDAVGNTVSRTFPDGWIVNPDAYIPRMKAQLKDLIDRYDPAVLWFDGEWIPDWTAEMGDDLENYLRHLKPDVIINERIGKRALDDGDFATAERFIHGSKQKRDWESCLTMNGEWYYCTNAAGKRWRSVENLVRTLVSVVARNGNLLLNIGPNAAGVIEKDNVVRLQGVGQWLAVNGESIYGTQGSPFAEALGWGECTMKAQRLYLHVFEWPADGKLAVAGLRSEVGKAYLLADKQREGLEVARDKCGLVVTLPGSAVDAIDSVVVVELSGPLLIEASEQSSSEQ